MGYVSYFKCFSSLFITHFKLKILKIDIRPLLSMLSPISFFGSNIGLGINLDILRPYAYY